jgi:uncharacterized membrane protein YphA (DoxX/SURF4 family)
MNVVLWLLQLFFGVMFVFHGFMMLNPPARLNPMMSYVHDLPANLRRFIGVVEVLGGFGLVLPALLNVQPTLTPLAAAGLAFVMVLAAVYHFTRKEYPNIVFNLVLAAAVAFIAYGRFVLLPF